MSQEEPNSRGLQGSQTLGRSACSLWELKIITDGRSVLALFSPLSPLLSPTPNLVRTYRRQCCCAVSFCRCRCFSKSQIPWKLAVRAMLCRKRCTPNGHGREDQQHPGGTRPGGCRCHYRRRLACPCPCSITSSIGDDSRKGDLQVRCLSRAVLQIDHSIVTPACLFCTSSISKVHGCGSLGSHPD